MRFIELTGQALALVIDTEELHADDLQAARVEPDSIVRVSEVGDVEVRRRDQWDLIGGLLGDFDDRVKRVTGLDWV